MVELTNEAWPPTSGKEVACADSARVLVTGGAGFIGSHLVRGLLRHGHRVRVLDNYATGKRAHLAEVLDQIEMLEGDVADPVAARLAVADVEVIFHLAAIPSVSRSVNDPLRSHQANATGTLSVLTAARDAGVRRVIYAASSSAYGDAPTLPQVETLPPSPVSPYAVSKLAGEGYCRAFHRAYGLETVALRYFNVFGPRQDPLSPYAAVIPRFITAMLQGAPLTIFGDGEQSRDFTYVANAVQANLLAMAAPQVAGEVLNIACGERTSLSELIAHLSRILQVEPCVRYTEARPSDVKHSLADITKAQRLLGYQPEVSLLEGLARTIEHLTLSKSLI